MRYRIVRGKAGEKNGIILFNSIRRKQRTRNSCLAVFESDLCFEGSRLKVNELAQGVKEKSIKADSS